MSELPAAEVSRRQANIRYLLNSWDFLGVAEIVDDEYNCLVAPLWGLLQRYAGRAEVSEFLWYELADHFGINPAAYSVDTHADRFVALAAAWRDADLRGTAQPAPRDYER